ncbi:Uncharacterised protein [Serratia fonticola]|nr:Uncharacterised protein [Serratia fonticola]
MANITVIVKMREIPHASQRGCGLWRSPEVECKHVTFEGKDQHNDKDEDRQDFGDGGNGVDSRSAFHPTQYQNVESPKNNRGEQHRRNGITVAKYREEGPQSRFYQHKVRDVTNTGPGPEAKCSGKSQIITESGFGIDKYAGIEIGFTLRQRLKHKGQH